METKSFIMEEYRRMLSAKEQQEDQAIDIQIRPKSLGEFVGQSRLKDNLRIAIAAAKQRSEQLDHVLFYGPPGLGKTTLSHILAFEMGVNIKVTSGPALERAGDLASVLTNLEPGDMLFIDEIHRLNRAIEEVLYSAMEDYVIDLVLGKGPNAQSVRLDLPKFTLVGATTRLSLLSGPLRDRFGSIFRLDYYSDDEMRQIVARSARLFNANFDDDAVREVAARSRKTPRVANRIIRRVRDYAQVNDHQVITRSIAEKALSLLDIDSRGLDEIDRRMLFMMINHFGGGPVGLQTISAFTGEEVGTIEEVYEPYLMQLGFLSRTPRGRVVTELAYEHLGVVKPKVKGML